MHTRDSVLDPMNVEPRTARSVAIAGRTPRRPADRGDRRPGSWSHPAPVAAVLAGAVHQPLNLALGEVAPLDCQVYDAWCAFLGCRFHADKFCLRVAECLAYMVLLNSQSEQIGMRAAVPPGRPGRSARARPVWQREIGEPNRAPIILADCSALVPGRGDFLF